MGESKTQDKLLKWLMPVANKIESQKHLQAIKDGMIAVIPVLIVGSIFILPIAFMNLFPNGAFHDFIERNLDVLTYGDQFTNGILSLYAAFFIGDSLAKRYKLKSTQYGITSVIVHIILSGVVIEGGFDTSFLGAEGLFTSIISAILTIEITRLLVNKKIIINLPDSVPEMVGDSFRNLIPMVVNVVIATIIASVSIKTSGLVFPELVMNTIAPAIKTMDSLPALLIVIFLTQLLWFFGLHGPAITSAVWAPFAISYTADNLAAYAAGETVTHIFTFGFYYNIMQVTGSGLTLGLVILMMRSRAKGQNALGKAAIIPSIFGINEPVIFGAPIILNPLLFIPFVFGPLVITVIAYLSMQLGIVGMPIANPPSFLPIGVGAYLLTFDWKAVVLVIASVIFMTLMYLPFYKVMEKNELKKEQSTE